MLHSLAMADLLINFWQLIGSNPDSCKVSSQQLTDFSFVHVTLTNTDYVQLTMFKFQSVHCEAAVHFHCLAITCRHSNMSDDKDTVVEILEDYILQPANLASPRHTHTMHMKRKNNPMFLLRSLIHVHKHRGKANNNMSALLDEVKGKGHCVSLYVTKY